MEMAGCHTPMEQLCPEWLTLPGTLQMVFFCWAVTTAGTPRSLSAARGVSVSSHWTILSGWDDNEIFLFKNSLLLSSYACAINDGTEVILTGGFGNRKDVLRYSMTGFEGFLPFLNEGRQYHACARFTDPYGKNVEISFLKICFGSDNSHFRHFWWLVASQDWRTQNPQRSLQLEHHHGLRLGICLIQGASLEQPMWTTSSTFLVNIISWLFQ